MAFQSSGEIVFIDGWEDDDDFGIHPKGSQPKRVVFCPDIAPFDFLIPGHAYIFKTAKKDWQAQQLWSEVIAYRIACLAGVVAPPCFVAADRRSGEVGVLMEFFFGYPGEIITPRLVHGGDVLARMIADRKKGRPHGVKTNIAAGRIAKVSGIVEWWGRALVFDALVANVDRHPDNWGFLVSVEQTITWRMAPLFDNGTSLGYGLRDEDLSGAQAQELLTRFASRGRHHCGWDAADDTQGGHVNLCRRFAGSYPGAVPGMKNVIRFDQAELDIILTDLVQFDTAIRFTEARAAFISSLVELRKNELAEVLGL